MPIYAPTLPPRPDLTHGSHPSLVMARFDLRRTLRQRVGRFFGFAFLMILIMQLGTLYLTYLVDTNQGFAAVKDFAHQVLNQGASFQADRLGLWLMFLLWLLAASVGGGLVARDTLYRVRPLIYAHPVRPLDYLAAKGLFAASLPFLVQATFVLVPWALSMAIAGANGPIWLRTPLLLLPAALINALLYGAITTGVSAMAATPRAGVGGIIGVVLGLSAVAGILTGLMDQTAFMALSPVTLAAAWPRLFCGVEDKLFGWGPAVAGTAFHLVFWTFVAWKRTRPSEAIL